MPPRGLVAETISGNRAASGRNRPKVDRSPGPVWLNRSQRQPNLVELGLIVSKWGTKSSSARNRLHLGGVDRWCAEFRPESAAPMVSLGAELVQHRPNLARVRPTLAAIWGNFGPDSAARGPESTTIGLGSTTSDQDWPGVDELDPGSAKIGPESMNSATRTRRVSFGRIRKRGHARKGAAAIRQTRADQRKAS